MPIGFRGSFVVMPADLPEIRPLSVRDGSGSRRFSHTLQGLFSPAYLIEEPGDLLCPTLGHLDGGDRSGTTDGVKFLQTIF